MIFSVETLRPEESGTMYLVMKRKNLQPRILYSARLSFRFNREIRSLTDKPKLKRIQHHQTSFATNAIGASLGEKQKTTTRNKIMKVGNHPMHKYDIKTSNLEKR